ncbi:hypothetical protein ACMBCM_05525, partial [Spiroplasma sp. K1]
MGPIEVLIPLNPVVEEADASSIQTPISITENENENENENEDTTVLLGITSTPYQDLPSIEGYSSKVYTPTETNSIEFS